MSRRNRKIRIRRKHTSLFSRRSLPGSAPGTLIVDPNAPKSIIRLVAFGPDKVVEREIPDVQTIRSFVGQWPVTWINVTVLGDLSVITRLGHELPYGGLAMEHAGAEMGLGISFCPWFDGSGRVGYAAFLPNQRVVGEGELADSGRRNNCGIQA